MPNNGRIVEWDALEIGVRTSVDSGYTAVSHQASLTASYTPDSVQLEAGLSIQISAHVSPGASYSDAVYEGPGAPYGGYSVHRDGNGASAEMSVRLRGIKLYFTLLGALSRLFFESVEVYVDGVYDITLPGSSGDFGSGGCGPCYIPLIGFPPIIDVTGRGYGVFSGNGGGGWRFREIEDGPWRTLPALSPPVTTPGGGDGLPSVTVSSTWGSQINWDMYNPEGGLGRDVYYDRSQIVLLPNLPTGIRRHRSGYAAMIFRKGFPKVSSLGNVWKHALGSNVFSNDTAITETHPRLSQFLAVIGDGAHTIEDPFGYEAYCPVSMERYRVNGVASPAYEARSTFRFPYEVDTASQNPQQGGYLDHNEPLVRYVNYWGHRLWHFFFWKQDWSDLPHGEYWGPLRQQWLHNDALPPADDRHTRTDLIGSCHEESGHTPFLDEFCGGLRWAGCSRWRTYKPTIPAERALDDSGNDRWSFGADGLGEGSLDPGGVTLGDGETAAAARLLSWYTAPYLYGAICDRVRLAAPTNVASWKAYVVGVDGEFELLADAPGTYKIPRAKARKYAGSWGIDNGIGSADDLGVDLKPGGISASVMGDPETLIGFELLTGASARHLRFVVVPNGNGPVTIPYPVLVRDADAPTLVWESAQVCALLYPDGAMVRLGNWIWYVPGVGLLNPPLVNGAGYKSTIVDALCTTRMIWEGRAHDDGLTTQLTELYDFFEGQSLAVVDKFGISYPLSKTNGVAGTGMPFALVNTMAEIPPLAMFPGKAYDAETWEPTSSYTNEVWDHAQEPRFLIVPGEDPMHLKTPAGGMATTLSGLTVPGWTITEHKRATTNDEGSVFKLVWKGQEWARASAWRGFVGVFGAIAENLRKWVAYDVSASVVHAWARPKEDGTMRLSRSSNAAPLTLENHETSLDADWLRMCWTRGTAPELLYVWGKDGHAFLSRGRIDAEPVLVIGLGDAKSGAPRIGANTELYIYLLDGGTVVGETRDNFLQIVRPRFSTNLTGLDEEVAMDFGISVKDGKVIVLLTGSKDGEERLWRSEDGVTFS